MKRGPPRFTLFPYTTLFRSKRIMRPSDILSVGQEVEAVVLGVNKEEQKISLGLRQLEPNPWDEIEKKFEIGSRVDRKSTRLNSSHANISYAVFRLKKKKRKE